MTSRAPRLDNLLLNKWHDEIRQNIDLQTYRGNRSFGLGLRHDGYTIRASSEIETTDAVQTTLDSITLEDENTYHVKALVVGVQSTGGNRASYEFTATVYRTASGSATLQGAVTSIHSRESDAAWDATFTVSGNDLRVSVTGAAATTIEWGCTLLYINMSN